MAELSERDRDFLACLADGETIAAYARRNNYSRKWGEYESRKLRRRFGVDTIEEVMLMADDDGTGVSRADFDKLTGLVTRLGESLEELAKRPNDPQTQQQAQQRELDVKDHAKALGLSLEDVEKLKGEKEYARFKAMQQRLDEEREAEEGNEGDDGANGGRNVGDVIRDGLGGITNRARQQ